MKNCWNCKKSVSGVSIMEVGTENRSTHTNKVSTESKIQTQKKRIEWK